MPHPFADLLRAAPLRRLWSGSAAAALGDEVARIALVWVAVGLIGTDVGYLQAAQYAALLVVTLAAGLVADAVPPARALVGLGLLAGLASLIPIAWFAALGPAVVPLVAAAVALSVLRGLYNAILLAQVPRLAGAPDLLQAANGLFDATARAARLLGPALAGLLALALPALQLFAVNALAQTACALAAWRARGGLPRTPSEGAAEPAVRRVLRGWAAVRGAPEAALLLGCNLFAVAAWNLGVVLGIALLLDERPLADGVAAGATVYALVMGAYGLGDLVSNLLVGGRRGLVGWRAMFAGYLVLGAGLAALPLAPLWLPEAAQLPATMLLAAVSGLGGPLFYLPMMARLQARFAGADLAAVIRLRLAGMAAGLLASALLAPALFAGFGAVATICGAGAAVALVGLAGALRGPTRS